MIKKAAPKHQKQGIKQVRMMRKSRTHLLNDLEEVGGISEKYKVSITHSLSR